MAKKILILNGPNLNMLGTREPETYGSQTLGEVEQLCIKRATSLGLGVEFLQSNSEGELVDYIQGAKEKFDGIIINPAAYSHTSIAIRDALISVDLPIIEVHISNIFKRETFRHHSYVSPVANGIICGLGTKGYLLALEALVEQL